MGTSEMMMIMLAVGKERERMNV